MAETNGKGVEGAPELELVGDTAFGAHPVAGPLGGEDLCTGAGLVDDVGDEERPEREVPFATACREYRGKLNFHDVSTIRQLVLAEPTGKDALALRDLVRDVLKLVPPEAALYDNELAEYLKAQPEESRQVVRDSADYERRVFAFYSTALMRLESRIARDPRALLTARAARGGPPVPARTGRRRRVGGS